MPEIDLKSKKRTVDSVDIVDKVDGVDSGQRKSVKKKCKLFLEREGVLRLDILPKLRQESVMKVASIHYHHHCVSGFGSRTVM